MKSKLFEWYDINQKSTQEYCKKETKSLKEISEIIDFYTHFGFKYSISIDSLYRP